MTRRCYAFLAVEASFTLPYKLQFVSEISPQIAQLEEFSLNLGLKWKLVQCYVAVWVDLLCGFVVLCSL
jgi:hypothetical protein